MIYGDHRDFLLANPDMFILHYFAHRIKHLKDFHIDLMLAATSQVRALYLYPAGHGKTTLISTLLPIYGLCLDPNTRIAVIVKNDQEAENISRVIQAELTGNQRLIDDFGPFKPTDDKVWSLSKMSVHHRTRVGKENTLAFFGAGARDVLGYRTDWTILDDIVSGENSTTPLMREKVREWFNLTVETGPEHEDSRITVVGTLFDPQDLYHDLREMLDPEDHLPIYRTYYRDAIVDEEKQITLWPEAWTWKRLMKKKATQGTLAFNKRYRNIAVDKSRMVFREEYVRGGYIGEKAYPGCIDKTHRVGDFDPSWSRYCAFDPAVGRQAEAKFCAHITLAVGSCIDHERCFWVVDLVRDQMTQPQQIDLIIEKHRTYGAFKSVVEANSYQAGLYQSIEQKLKDQNLALRIEPHYTTRINKPDVETGVQAMAPYFENGLVHIPWGNPESSRKMKVLVDELIMYPGRTTDTVMAFWMAWRDAQISAPLYKSYSRYEPKQLPRLARASRNVWVNPYYAREPHIAGGL